ncbi:PREDICTED: metabotropic glutamate receptor-like protein R [Rhagoletis zephyria]|uniref:metabotropic glutamate receptor-like protein R n=1 Tax=Rhagoletis zephyria TaxID=28612 RepID=UPI0008115651|nr:PREDICTED: metabotropic glutamate receptor-like protein R [Rhagoletis zephyria]
MAEKGVAIAKNILKRCYETNEVDHFQYRIMEYNTTPVAISEKMLIRNNVKEEINQNKINRKKEQQKYYYDRNAKSLPKLSTGDLVIFKKNGKEWHYGKITGTVNDCSYIIKDSFDNYFRRNRRLIVKTNNDDFNASDFFLEENIKVGCRNNLPETQIVPDNLVNNQSNNCNNQNCINQNNNYNDQNYNNNQDTANTNPINTVIADEPKLSVEHENEGHHNSPSDYETAESDESDANMGSESGAIPEPAVRGHYRTRSGRSVRPPQKYGC